MIDDNNLTFRTEKEYIEAIDNLNKKTRFIEAEKERIIRDEHLYREKKSIGFARFGEYHTVPLKWADTVFCDKRYKNKFLKQTSCSLNDIERLIPNFEYHAPLYVKRVYTACDGTYNLELSDPYASITVNGVNLAGKSREEILGHIVYCGFIKKTDTLDPSVYSIKITSIVPKSYGLYGHNNETSISEREKAAKNNPNPIYNAFAEPKEAILDTASSTHYGLFADRRAGFVPKPEQFGKTTDKIVMLWVREDDVVKESNYRFEYATMTLTPINEPCNCSDNGAGSDEYLLYIEPENSSENYAPYTPDIYRYTYESVPKPAHLQKFREVVTYNTPNYLSDEELQYFTLKYAQENFSETMTEVDAARAINNIEHYVMSHNIEENEKNFGTGYHYTVPMMDRTEATMSLAKQMDKFTWGGDFRNGYPYFDVKEFSATECRILVSCIQKAAPSGESYFLALDAKLRYLLRDDLFSMEKRNEYLRNDVENYLARLRSHAISKKSMMDYANTLSDEQKIAEFTSGDDLPIGTEEQRKNFQEFIDEDAKVDFYPHYRYGIDAPSFTDTVTPHKKDPLAFLYRRLPYKMITIKYDSKQKCLVYSESTQFYYNSMRPVLSAKYDRETIERTRNPFFYYQTVELPKNFEEVTGHTSTVLNRFVFFEFMKETTEFTFWFYDKYLRSTNQPKGKDIPEAQLEEEYRNFKKLPKGAPFDKDLYYEVFKEDRIRRENYDNYSAAASKLLGYGENYEFMLCGDFSDSGPFGAFPKWVKKIPHDLQDQFFAKRKESGLDSFDKFYDGYLELIKIQDEYVKEFKEFDTKYGMIDYVSFIANLKRPAYERLIECLEQAEN